jgi:hypothetical protein
VAGLQADQQTVGWLPVCDCYVLHFLLSSKHYN